MENERNEQQKLDVAGHRANDPLFLPADTVLRMQIGIPYGLAALAADYATHWNGNVFLSTTIAGAAMIGAAPELLAWERDTHTIRRLINTLAHLRRSPLTLYQAPQETKRVLQQMDDRIVDADVEVSPNHRTDLTVGQKQTGPRRLTIDEIVAMCEYNSFKIYIGSSLTDPEATPVEVRIFKQHFKFIGASQKGKSSMAAAFLEIITRTHDTSRVLIALLDFEDMTSKLFAHLPHLAEVEVDGKHIPLHATTREQVLEHLGYIVELVKIRYGMTKLEIKDEPLLIVYLEEFLALKDYFKSQAKSAIGESEKKQAEKNYTDLVFRIKEIARLGLKARVQLVMCAQVDYADEDFREALANVTNGMSFCVKPTAAQAAGFMNAELLARNAQAKKVGQAVAETVSCNDLVLAPAYDLEARLVEFEERELEEERRNPQARSAQVKSNFLTPVGGHRGTRQTQRQVTTSNLAAQREAILNLHRTGKIDVLELADLLFALPTEDETAMDDLPMIGQTEQQISHSRERSPQQDLSNFVSSKYQTAPTVNEYVNVPVERVNDRESPREILEGVETIHEQNSPKFTPEQVAEVLKAYSVLAKDLAKTGQVVTRNALRSWLYENVSKTWNTSQKNYDVFKAICDEYEL